MENSIKNKLVLSSTSQARIDLLKQFNINFETYAPNIDETPLKNEFPKYLVKRLSLLKAQTSLPYIEKSRNPTLLPSKFAFSAHSSP